MSSATTNDIKEAEDLVNKLGTRLKHAKASAVTLAKAAKKRKPKTAKTSSPKKGRKRSTKKKGGK